MNCSCIYIASVLELVVGATDTVEWKIIEEKNGKVHQLEIVLLLGCALSWNWIGFINPESFATSALLNCSLCGCKRIRSVLFSYNFFSLSWINLVYRHFYNGTHTSAFQTSLKNSKSLHFCCFHVLFTLIHFSNYRPNQTLVNIT